MKYAFSAMFAAILMRYVKPPKLEFVIYYNCIAADGKTENMPLQGSPGRDPESSGG
jgi:hypothetical protein